MNNKLIADQLSQLIANEEHSLMRHLHEATPYVSPATFRVWRQIQKQAAAREHHVAQLTSLFEILDESPHPGVFPTTVGFFHFTDVPTLLPELIHEQQQHIADYETAIRTAGSQPTVVAALQDILKDKREQLAELQTAHEQLAAAAT